MREVLRSLRADEIHAAHRWLSAMTWSVRIGHLGSAGCCDPFNDKAIRAGRGATFKLPLSFGDWDELQSVLKKHDLTCYAADSQGASGNRRRNFFTKIYQAGCLASGCKY